MAKKGQIFVKHSKQLKIIILKEYDEGNDSPRSLGVKYGVSRKTIENWIAKRRKGINVTVDHRKTLCGRWGEKNLTIEDYKERYEILKKYQAFLEARHGKK